MFAIGSKVVSRVVAKTQIQSVRNANLMATIPQNRIPFAQKAVHGVVMFFGLLAVPAYIASNLKNYRGDSEK